MAYKDREWCKERGICTRCKKQEAFNGHSLCADCMYYYAEYYHKRMSDTEFRKRVNETSRRYKQKKNAEKKAKGLCRACGKPVCERSKVYCDRHRIAYNAYKLQRYYETHVYKTEEEMKIIKAEAARRIKEGHARWVAERMRLKAEKVE